MENVEHSTPINREQASNTQRPSNHVLLSGCDVPASAPLASLDAFFAAAKSAAPFTTK